MLAVQRKHEERRSLFSCFYWAIFSWNSQEMAAAGAPPPRSLWGNVLVSARRIRGNPTPLHHHTAERIWHPCMAAVRTLSTAWPQQQP